MSGSVPEHWLDRVAESLREHEDRASSIQNAPPRYEVLGEISRGGMGIIYRAWDPQLGRNVALKVLRSEGNGTAAEAHERFQREAKLAAGLHHPNIVQIFDTGTWQGQDYIAMQFIEGSTLDRANSDRRQSLASIRDAARALHYAHEQGIVHRDVKPGNLLVDKAGRVYVTDFGVAREVVAPATLTNPGTVVGTPAYMSPEQAQGMPTDARSDVYSLGATLYEMVVGRPPVPGTNALEVLEAVRTKDPELPCKVVPELSKNVEAIILGAMDRVRDERYPTAAALADDIERYLNGERPLRRPRGLSYKFRREFVRHPWRSTGAIVLCALLILAGVFLGYFIRGWIHLSRAEHSRNEEEQIREYKIAATIFPSARDRYEILTSERDKRLADHRIVIAAAFEREEKERKEREAEKERKENAARLKQMQEELDETRKRELIARTCESALNYLDKGNLVEAAKEIDGLRVPAPKKYDELLPKLRKAQFSAGLQELSTFADRADLGGFDHAYKSLRGTVSNSQPDFRSKVAPLALQLAAGLKSQNRATEAVDWCNVAESLGYVDPRLYEVRGIALIALERWEEAQHDYQELVGRTPGKKPPAREFAVLPLRKGQLAAEQKDWVEAIKNFGLAVWIDSDLAAAYHDRGLARFRSNGQAREALEEELKIALEKDPKLIPAPQYRDVVLAFARSQAARFWAAEDARERESVCREAVVWLTRLLQGKSAEDPELLLERSRMYRRLGDLPSAISEARRCVPVTAETALNLGVLLFLQSHSEKNDARMREAIEQFDQAERLAPADPRPSYWRGLCRRNLVAPDLDGALKDFLKSAEVGVRSTHLALESAKVRLDIIGRDKDPKGWPAALDDGTHALTGAEVLSEEEYVAGFHEQRRVSRSQAIRLVTRDAYLVQGQAFYYGKEYPKSIEACSAAIQVDPQYASPYLWRGYARCDDKQHHKLAQEDFRQTVRLSTHADEKDNAGQWLSRCQKHARD
jgi:tetratricopeptide (TPR) repeat protein